VAPYGDFIHDHFRNPRNWGSLDAPDFRCEGHNPFCGDRVRIELAVSPADAITAARFQGDLCVIAKAATSLLTERLVGLPLQSAAELDDDEFIASLQFPIPQPRRSCALLALHVVQASTEATHD
jgi:nitrogen fixation NifU-like protein